MELLHALGINWQLLLAQIVNFAIVLFVLTKFVYRPLLTLIDERRAAAAKAVQAVEDARRQTEQTEALKKKRLREAETEAVAIIENAKKQAEKIGHEMMEKATQVSDQIIERGNQAVAQERTKALKEVQETVAKVVIDLTQSLLRRTFDDKDQKRMFKDLLEKLPALMA